MEDMSIDPSFRFVSVIRINGRTIARGSIHGRACAYLKKSGWQEREEYESNVPQELSGNSLFGV